MKLLVIYGGTKEAIDPIRYISNFSSGKMGRALVKTAKEKGLSVKKILAKNHNAKSLYQAIKKVFFDFDFIIMVAAVADYKPIAFSPDKIKKSQEIITLKLEKTIDILYELGKIKRPKQKLIGFCLETIDLIKNAKQKLQAKNLDLIIANGIESLGGNKSKQLIIGKDLMIELDYDDKQINATKIIDHILRL